MICKKCKKSRLRNKEDSLCVACQMEEDILEVVPEISTSQKEKLLETIWKWTQEAWDYGAHEAANDIGSRI